MAEIIGMDHNKLWMYDKGGRKPQPRTIRGLAETLGVEVGDLLKEDR